MIARAHRREFILNSREMKELFLDVVKRAKEKYKFKVINYVIMGNHIHMMIKPGEKENLSKIMQWILSVFAVILRQIIRIYRVGVVRSVQKHYYKGYKTILKTFEYIVLNPVKAEIVKRALRV